MAERAAAIGARLAWTAPEGGGTLVTLDVPLRQLHPGGAAANPHLPGGKTTTR
jgi:hypothetical protein